MKLNILDINQLKFAQTQTPIVDLIDTLKAIEINPTDICNRKCSFCPQSIKQGRPQKNYLSVELVDTLSKQLNEFNFSGSVSFVGFGEPLLNPQLLQCISTLKKNSPQIQNIIVNTNGDFLTRELIESLAHSGCNQLIVSMYDKDDSDRWMNLCAGISIDLSLKHFYPGTSMSHLVNRNQIYSSNEELRINKACYIPFYKLFIDWDGKYLLCSQDWKKETADESIYTLSVQNRWKQLRLQQQDLLHSKRESSPCSRCDVGGTKYGVESFEFVKGRTI